MVDFYRLKNRLRLFLPISNFPWLTSFKVFDAQPERILCLTAAGLGDTIMDAPAIYALKKKFPNAKLSAVVHYNRAANEVCRLMPSVDETIDIGLKNYRWGSVIRFMCGRFWRLLFQLRKRRFDLAVVFWPNPIRRLLMAGLGSKSWMYGNLIDDYPGEQNRRLLRLIGIEVTETNSIFQVPKPADAERILPSNLPRPLIGVHPFRGGGAWREWNKFEDLLEELSGRNGSVVVVGKRDGYETSKRVHNLVNRLSVKELFWVIGRCDVFVTADSGPMHIAFVLDTPTVALFGPVRPQLLAPPAVEQKHRVLYKGSIESEKIVWITERRKLDNTALQEISVEEVIASVEEILRQSG